MGVIGRIIAGSRELVGLAVRAALRDRRTEGWKALAEACGLTDVEQSDGFGSSGDVSGNRGCHQVRLERYSRGRHVRGSRIVVRGLVPDVSLRCEDLGTRIGKAFGGEDLTLGDPLFDQEIRIRGPEPLLRGLLDEKTRKLLQDAFRRLVRAEGGVVRSIDSLLKIESGELTMELEDRFQATDEPAVETLQAALALAERLAPIERLEPRLAHNARHDPVTAVRSGALAMLAGFFPAAGDTRAAMRGALEADQPDLRLQAALWLGDEGRATLLELLADPTVPDALLKRAFEALGSRTTVATALALMQRALGSGFDSTALACLAWLGRGRGPESIAALAKVLGPPPGIRAPLAVQAARSLGETRDARAEGPLLRALEHAEPSVREAAALALGHVGSVGAVAPLRDLEARDGEERAVRRAARVGVADIQSRLAGASPGQLALADGSDGQVSLADDAAGRVALTPDANAPRPKR